MPQCQDHELITVPGSVLGAFRAAIQHNSGLDGIDQMRIDWDDLKVCLTCHMVASSFEGKPIAVHTDDAPWNHFQ